MLAAIDELEPTVIQQLQPFDIVGCIDDLEQYLRAAANQHPLESDNDVREFLAGAVLGRGLVSSITLGELEVGTVACELIRDRNGDRVLWVRYLVGERMDYWLGDLTAWLQEVARAEGCTRIGLSGRRGWIRELSRFGYKDAATVLLCEVQP